MINRGLQCFVQDMYGQDRWDETCSRAELNFMNFETMLVYEDSVTERILDALQLVLGRMRHEVLEDFGTYVVSHEHLSSVTRLLRLGGDTYEEFLHSLEDVYDRAKVAMPDLDVPKLRLDERSDRDFTLEYEFAKLGYGTVLLGLLRAMADDYETLVTIDHRARPGVHLDCDTFHIQVVQHGWTESSAMAGAG